MPQHITGIDHLLILVSDLDAAAATYQRLGFTISPLGMHSAHMGTGNHTIMLQDDYIELLAVLNPTDQNEGMRERLKSGEGLFATALRTDDAAAMGQELSAAGIKVEGPTTFSRPVDLPDGSASEAAFSITRVVEPGSYRDNIFGCQHLTRGTVWMPSLMSHANSAVGIMAVNGVADDPNAAAEALCALYGGLPQVDGGRHIIDANGTAVIIEKGDTRGWPLRFTAITLAVNDLGATRTALSGVPHQDDGDLLTVPADAAHGVAITFKHR